MLFGNPSAAIMWPRKLDTMNPIQISDPVTSLEVAFVPRYSIEHLSADWKREDLRGIYILLSDLQFTSTFKVYVGSVDQGFEQALYERNEKSSFWSNVVLFANHDGVNLTDEQATKLATYVGHLLNSGNHIKVLSEHEELPELPSAQLAELELMALFVVRVLFLQGYRSHSLAKAVHPLELHATELDDGSAPLLTTK